ncbi:unnamed protein product [Paramecium sonneborni]|uniref:Tetraspanin family protein n=1 Tax=Paramecium sonneborni TaxID=65129 RepID=A0A8S1Q7H9_9CILI|nr:unnamed protein product [Paramecium sonneborni]
MCLPYGCLKCFVLLEGWLTLVLGILAVIAAIIITVIQRSFDSALKDLGIGDVDTSAVTVFFWIFASIVLFLAICGLCGTKHKSKCLLAIFNIGNICLFLAFASLAIAAYVFGSVFNDQKCNQSNENYKTIENLYSMAEKTLCQDACECYYSQEVNSNVAPAVKKYSSNDSSKPKNFQSCQVFDKNYDIQASALSWMEEKLECSGWCTGYPIQLFNNVNSQVKNYNNPCYDAMLSYLQGMFNTMGTTLISLASIFLVMIVFTCCLCCHPKNSNRGQDYYTRLAYVAD